MNMDRLTHWLELDQRAKDLKADLESITEQKSQLEEQIIRDFEEEGVESMKVLGRTVYTQRNLWAGVKEGSDKAAACDALKEAGLGDFVAESFNTQTLSAYFRELEKSAKSEGRIIMEPSELIPSELQSTIKLSEKFGLRSRKS